MGRILKFGLTLLFWCYVIMAIFNILFMPWITLWIIWEEMTVLQICMCVIYIRAWLEIIYRLYWLISGDILLSRIPNLMTYYKYSVKREEPQNMTDVYDYYQWIKQDARAIKGILISAFGDHVGEILLLDTPDYSRLYKEQQAKLGMFRKNRQY